MSYLLAQSLRRLIFESKSIFFRFAPLEIFFVYEDTSRMNQKSDLRVFYFD